MKTEWHNAPDFAEVAEALNVNTIDVMAMLPDQIVLYTPHPNDDDPQIFKAKLGRDTEGILRAGPGQFVANSSEWEAKLRDLLDQAEGMGE